MHYYSIGSALAASPLPDLPFEKAADGVPSLFLTDRDPQQGPAAWRLWMSPGWTLTGWGRHRSCRRVSLPPSSPAG